MFTFAVLATALFIEAIGTYISVLGLSALFAGSIVVTTMAVALDVGKVVAVSFLYKYWKDLSLLMKSYMLSATLVLMLITSSGVFGYLSGEFQKAMSGNSQQTVLIASLEEEQTRLQARKQEIDAQITNLPANAVRSRVRLMAQFKDETTRINTRLVEIDTELPKMKVDIIGQSVKIGPIIYIAEAFKTTPEQAVKWIILIIIFVFDPLAIALLIAGNFLLMKSKKDEDPLSDLSVTLQQFDPEQHGGEFGRVSLGPQEYIPDPEEEKFYSTVGTPPVPQPAPPPELELVPVWPDAPAPEPLVDPEPASADEEIITMEQLQKPPVQMLPASSLDKIDARSGDVVEVMGEKRGSHRAYHDPD